MKINVNIPNHEYEVLIEKGALKSIHAYIKSYDKVLIVSDDLIPDEYVELVNKDIPNSFIKRFKHGENNKTLITYQELINSLIEHELTRKDAIIALGGGLTSDLAGFVASSYMRGIDFYIIPTTVLSSADASIGGKVAVNHKGIKNIVGAFYQPKKVIIDPTVFNTLSERLIREGYVEIIKMAAIYDRELFEYIEKTPINELDIEKVLYNAITIKNDVVSKDEKETGLRSILNFGHTVGHAIEALGNGKYYHGEAVGMGMLYFSNGEVRQRIKDLLIKFSLPIKDEFSTEELMKFIMLDKKKNANKVKICRVNHIGSYVLEEISIDKLKEEIRSYKDEK